MGMLVREWQGMGTRNPFPLTSTSHGEGSLKSTYLQFSRCYIFVSFRNIVGINCTLRPHTQRSGFMPATIRMTLNDLECPVQLKVRFTDGTLDVRIYVVDFEALPRVTRWTRALAVSDQNVANELQFQTIWGLYEFSSVYSTGGDEQELSCETWLFIIHSHYAASSLRYLDM